MVLRKYLACTFAKFYRLREYVWLFYYYCCTVHFEDSLSIAHQQMH
jgi:hypothetical protein